jgi:hypothetical protein
MVHDVEELTGGQRRLASVPPVTGLSLAASPPQARFAQLVAAVERPLRASLVAR